MSEHILSRYDEQLQKLLATLIKMGSLAQEQLEAVLSALDNTDTEAAQLVINRDAKIDKYDLKIEKRCLNLFALQQPVATDLRVIMSSLAINRSIERVGDYTVNIARAIIAGGDFSPLVGSTEIRAMGRNALVMFETALNAFIQYDPTLARKVIVCDSEVDELDRSNRAKIVDLMSRNGAMVPAGVALIGICRDLERIADESTNISEEVIFTVEATNVRHKHLDAVVLDEPSGAHDESGDGGGEE